MTARAPDPTAATFSLLKFRSFFELAKHANLDLAALLAPHGLAEAAVFDPDTRLPRLQCVVIMKQLFAALKDPLVGLHAAQRFELADLDLLGYLAQQYANPLAALEAVVGYASLVGDASRAELTREPGALTLTQWIAGDATLLPELADYLIASSHRAVCLLAGAEIKPLRVALARPRPANPHAYRQFFGAPVTFEALRGALIYPEAALQQSRAAGDPRLALHLSRQADSRLRQLAPHADLCERVSARIRAQLEQGPPDPAELARSLGLSERTLRRRLSEAGSSYRILLDTLRRDRALALTETGELRVTELAARLGFRDSTAFARAFRRWTGLAPSRYQRRPNSSAPHLPRSELYKPPSTVG